VFANSHFFNETVPNKSGNYCIRFKLGGRFGVSQTGAEDGFRSALADFLTQIKGPQHVERGVSINAACRRMRRLQAFLYLAAQNFGQF
jgi:hypothetical protein